MKSIKLSLIASLALSACTFASANSLHEALTNGKVSGEVAVTYETRNVDEKVGNYYQDTAYSVGSFALKYETGVWNNLSLTTKFRAYKTLFEEHDSLETWKGSGDASERFYENGDEKDIDAEEFFVKYQYDNFTLKAGRQFIVSDWFAKTHDAVKLDAVFGDTAVEAIWSKKIGRVYARDYRPMENINDSKGAYKLGITHKFNDNIKATVYDVYLPDNHYKLGGRLNLDYDKFSIRADYVQQKMDDDLNQDDTDFFHLKASTKIFGVNAAIGYAKVGDDKDPFIGYGAAGESLCPFEEGDAFYYRNAETYYASLSKSFGNLNATLIYGIFNDYKVDIKGRDSNNEYDANETTLWLGYKVSDNIKANVGYTYFNTDDVNGWVGSDMSQLNATLVYSF